MNSRTPYSIAMTLGAALASLYAYAHLFEIQQIDVRHVDVPLRRLPAAFDGYRLIHISDLHLDSWLGFDRLARLITQINALQPDMIAITGDFVHDELAPSFTEYIHALRGLRAYDGVVTVLGNHDHKVGAPGIRQLIRHSGAMDLSNRHVTLRRGADTLHIAGLDDVLYRQNDLPGLLEKVPASGATVLLVHEPDFAEKAAQTRRFDLQLSGHSHGGQINLPMIGAPVLPQLGQRYPHGLYQVEDMALYTTRGVGVIKPALRFNCRPEIAVLTLWASG